MHHSSALVIPVLACPLQNFADICFREGMMPSKYVGSKRLAGRGDEVPAELSRREAQDRAASHSGSGRAKSPIDSMHVDAPKRQDNARGHKQKRRT